MLRALFMILAILNQSAHASDHLIPTINTLLGAGHFDVDVFYDGTNLDATFDAPLATLAGNRQRVNYDLTTSTPANRAPYRIGNNSFADFDHSFDIDAVTYGALLDSWAYTVATSPGTAPPILCSTVARPGDFTGNGIEFCMPANFKGLDSSSTLSGATAVMSGALASFAYLRPGFTLNDVKAAFRQTAANWPTGYDSTNYGYGVINYDAALAIASPSQLYLQPPYFETNLASPFITYTLYPFRQSRRALDRVFAVAHGYPWPMLNELTNTELLDAGGIEIASNNSDGIASEQLDLSYLGPGRFDLVAFTCDAHGNFSRVESFSRVTLTI